MQLVVFTTLCTLAATHQLPRCMITSRLSIAEMRSWVLSLWCSADSGLGIPTSDIEIIGQKASSLACFRTQ